MRVVADAAVDAVARRALELIEDGARVGLGSGRTASAFVALLGTRVRAGLRVTGVPTSEVTARLARSVGIPLADLDERELDVTVDGADEVAPDLDLVKGWGGALVRERIVATSSRRQVIVVGADKLVDELGARGRIPVEVVPPARPLVVRRLGAPGLRATVRADVDGKRPFRSDNGNLIVDCAPEAPLRDHAAALSLETAVRSIPGVVDTGLFLGTAERVLVGDADGRVDTLRPR